MTERYEFIVRDEKLAEHPYHFRGAGLPNVYLMNGFKVERDRSHGETVTVYNLPALFGVIALTLVRKEGPLTGAEVRFLRKRMEMTQADLAHDLRVTDQTIANYEKGDGPTGPADKALRLMYLAFLIDDHGDDEVAEELRDQARELMPGRSRNKQLRGSVDVGPWGSS